MPRQGQIVPRFLHPHVETYINDNTIFEDWASLAPDDSVRMTFVIASDKGRDRTMLQFNNKTAAIEEFGIPNYEKHGQPIYNMYAALDSGNAVVNVMRIMPEDATFSNLIVLAKVKKDSGKLTVKYETKRIDGMLDKDAIAIVARTLATPFPEVDTEGYSVYPIVAFMSRGRGRYGNYFRTRLTSDILMDQDNDYKNYKVEVLTSDTGLVKKETHSVTINDMAVVNKTSLHMDEVVNDNSTGSTRIETYTDMESLKTIYNMYVELAGNDEDVVAYDEFDFLFGTRKDLTKIAKYEIDPTGVALDKVDGLLLSGGDEGAFSTTIPTPFMEVNTLVELYAIDATAESLLVGHIVRVKNTNAMYKVYDLGAIDTEEGWTLMSFDRVAAMDREYLAAFNGENGYDRALQSKRRTPTDIFLDGNYSAEVKRALATLALKRYDGRLILDAGILSTITQVNTWNEEFKNIADRIISKECQHYMIYDPFSGKRIPVTATYFMALYLPSHYRTFGNHKPFTGERYARLSGHIKNTLKPIIDADDLEVKEQVYVDRCNYFECIAENVFIRGAQGTSQRVWSDMSEENNVAVMLEMKRMLENYVATKTYDFAEAEDRKRFTEDGERMFAEYRNLKCRDFTITFDMNAWEEERSILHCYLGLTFKTLAKRHIIEIDINKRV